MKKIILFTIIAAAAVCLGACTTEADKLVYGKDVIMISGTDYSPMTQISVDGNLPLDYQFTVQSTGLVNEDIQVTLAYDAAAVDAYNASNGTKFVAAPHDAISLNSTTLTIKAGKAVSEPGTVTLLNNEWAEDGIVYIIPLSITSVSGGMEVLEVSRTILIRIKQVINFYSLLVDSANAASEYHWDDKAIELTNWTCEIKAYPTNLKSDKDEQICRLCAWKGNGQVLLRFNENGTPWKSLNFVTPGSKFSTNKIFEVNQWFHIALVYDGGKLIVYVDGEKDSELAADAETLGFSKFELGMAYGNYMSSQLYSGRVSEIRLWDRALPQSEIKEGMCSVSPQSEGLKGYWKLNDNGTVLKDSSASGYDMDTAHALREPSDNKYSNYNASGAIKWVRDNNNKCSL